MGVCPDATLLVAQIVGSLIPTVQKRYDSYNAKIPGVVQKSVDAGKHVLVVDARAIKGSLINTGMTFTRPLVTRKLPVTAPASLQS